MQILKMALLASITIVLHFPGPGLAFCNAKLRNDNGFKHAGISTAPPEVFPQEKDIFPITGPTTRTVLVNFKMYRQGIQIPN